MKNFSAALIAAGVSCCAMAGSVTFPVEWNRTYDTSLPYELEINRSRLAEISGSSSDTAFSIQALKDGKKSDVPVKLLPGREPGSVALHFQVPAGTDSLECTAAGKAAKLDAVENIFSGVLEKENLKRWKMQKDISVVPTEKALLFKNSGFGSSIVTLMVDVPAGWAGKPVRFELDVKSHTPLPWSNNIRVEQLDRKGKLLAEGAVRQEWISHMRPYNVLTAYRENGRIHPDAAKLRLRMSLVNPGKGKAKFGLDGLPLKNKSDAHAALEISHLSMRVASQLPFPKYNDGFFVSGVSGKPGDFALRLSRKTAFSHSTASQAVWGDFVQVKDPKSLFFPVGAAGTVEFFIKPDDWAYARSNSVVLLDAYNVIGMAGRTPVKRRNSIFELAYTPKKKQLQLTLKDGRDRVFKRSVKADIPKEKWSHIAAQWSSGGVQIYLDGRKIMDDRKYIFAPLDIAKMDYPNAYIPMQVTVGTTTPKYRNAGNYKQEVSPDYCGAFDLLRSSDVARYKENFTPSNQFDTDDATRALFGFDRSFDGVSGGGLRYLSGALRADMAMTDPYLQVNGVKKAYHLTENRADNDPSKVLDKLNYPVLPRSADFHAARKSEVRKFIMTPGKAEVVTIPETVYTDYVEIFNSNKERSLKFPAVINDGRDVDTRSFADIAESLKLDGKSDRRKVEDLFRFVLGVSDYFMTHQAYIPDGNDYVTIVENYPHTMLNGYCGFECGPLNNMTSALFTCSGKVPSRMVGGYAHAYEGVFYNGRTRIYDLSAQQFFPSWDNRNAATQDEIDIEVGLMAREKKNPNHFMRLTSRGGGYVNSPVLQRKGGVLVKPLERLRIYTSNNAIQNDLQCDRRAMGVALKKDVTSEVGVIGNKYPVLRVDRFFPHVATGFITLECVPRENSKAFSSIRKNSFCYEVETSYPIVRGRYSAYDKEGKPVKMTFITNRGKRQRTFEMSPDGSYELDYEVRARHKLLFRIEKPIHAIAKFTAETQFVMNPRVFTGKLHKGKNTLIFKEIGNSKAEVSVSFRKDVKPVIVEGGVYTAAIPGFEKQLFVAEPGKTSEFRVTGVSASAGVAAYGGISASLHNGVLKITPAEGRSRFCCVEINDNGAKKKLTFLVGKGIRLLTAAKFVPGKNASILKADKERIQDCVMLNDNGECLVSFDALPAGKYAIWNLNRFQSHTAFTGLTKRPLHMVLPGGKTIEAGSAINHVSDLYKAQYGKPGERSRFKWDFPIDPETRYWGAAPWMLDMPEFSELKFKCTVPNYNGIEIAAVLIVPEPSDDLRNDMVKILCGLNCDPWLK